jgi:hypothetical protein
MVSHGCSGARMSTGMASSTQKRVEGFDEVGKLGQSFCTVDELEEANLGQGDVLRPTYVNKGMPEENKRRLAELFQEFKGCFA